MRLSGAELFHADRQTDTMKIIVAFRNSTNAPDIADAIVLLGRTLARQVSRSGDVYNQRAQNVLLQFFVRENIIKGLPAV